MPSSGTSYYVRVRGRVRGPYDIARLKLLHARGQLSRVHQVSTDGQSWVSAATLIQVFVNRAPLIEPKVDPSADAQQDTKQWYYQKDEKSHGPVSDNELQAMINNGELSGGDPVCEVGATEWSTVDAIGSAFSGEQASVGTRRWPMVGLVTLAVISVVSLATIGIFAAIYFWKT